MQRRIALELKAIRDIGNDSSFSIIPKKIEDKEWILVLSNIQHTPYEDGKFDIKILFNDGYPFKKPNITFLTKIYHPNISDTGGICLDMLSDEGWTPSYTIRTCLNAICWLLRNPDVQNPSIPEIADVYISNIDLFNSNAKKWIVSYASP